MGRSRPESRRRRGALIIELLLGLTLITISILAIFSVFPMADRSVGHADRTAQANYIARSLLEQRLVTPYDDLPVTAVPEQGEIALQHSQRRGQKLSTTFEYQVEVTQPEPAKELKRIVVTVGWKRGSLGAPETVRMECDKGNLW